MRKNKLLVLSMATVLAISAVTGCQKKPVEKEQTGPIVSTPGAYEVVTDVKLEDFKQPTENKYKSIASGKIAIDFKFSVAAGDSKGDENVSGRIEIAANEKAACISSLINSSELTMPDSSNSTSTSIYYTFDKADDKLNVTSYTQDATEKEKWYKEVEKPIDLKDVENQVNEVLSNANKEDSKLELPTFLTEGFEITKNNKDYAVNNIYELTKILEYALEASKNAQFEAYKDYQDKLSQAQEEYDELIKEVNDIVKDIKVKLTVNYDLDKAFKGITITIPENKIQVEGSDPITIHESYFTITVLDVNHTSVEVPQSIIDNAVEYPSFDDYWGKND